jgi:hypothetical protein
MNAGINLCVGDLAAGGSVTPDRLYQLHKLWREAHPEESCDQPSRCRSGPAVSARNCARLGCLIADSRLRRGAIAGHKRRPRLVSS